MAKVKHDNGYIYSGYIVSNMTKEADWVK